MNDLKTLLLENIDNNIEIIILNDKEQSKWSRDLSELPLFTIKEIDKHRVKSGKQGKSIIKTMDRGRKFMEEGYIMKG